MKLQDFYKEHKKIKIFFTILFLLFFGIFIDLKYNLENTVEFITDMTLGTKFISSNIDIDLKNDKILIKDLKIERKNEIIIDAPLVEANIENIFHTFRIKEIKVDGGKANITRYKNGDVNIVAAFIGDSEEEKPETEEELKERLNHYDPGLPVPIDIIIAKNIKTIYRDNYYTLPIEEEINNTHGYLTFSNTQGIDLMFTGENGKEKYTYRFNNSKLPYWMNIDLQNIKVTTSLAQYGYYLEGLDYLGGQINMDLDIDTLGLLGKIDIKDAKVRYEYLDEDIKNINGYVDFNKKGIFLHTDFKAFNKPQVFNLSYVNDELNLGIKIHKLSNDEIRKIVFLKDSQYKDIRAYNLKLNLNYKDSILKLDTNIQKLNFDSNEITGINFKMQSKDEKNKMILSIKDINNLKFLQDQKLEFDYENNEKSIGFNLKSEFLNTKGNYLKNKKLLKLYDKNYFINYDIQNKKFIDGKGNFPIDIFGNRFLITYESKDSNIFMKKISLFNEHGITKNLATGMLDLKNEKFNLVFRDTEFKIHDFLNETKEPLIYGKLLGKVSGEKGNINLDLDLDNIGFNYLLNISGITGNLKFNNKEKLDLLYTGGIGEIKYDNFKIKGFKVVTRLKDDIFEIKSFEDRYINLNGKINLAKEKIDLKGKILNLPVEKVLENAPNIIMNKINLEFLGDLKNPNGKINIEDLEIKFDKKNSIKVLGDIRYHDKKISTYNLKVDNSLIRGQYDLEDKSYKAKINIIGEDLGKYYGNTSIQYRVIGCVNILGQDKKADIDLKSTIDKIYYAGKALPNVYLSANYNTDEIGHGKIDIHDITLSNQNLKKLLKAQGYYDLDEKYIEIDINNQEVLLKRLRNYIFLKKLIGKLNISGKLLGKIDNLGYNLSVKSDEFGAKEIKFNNLNFDVSGNMEEVNINDFSFKYLNNLFSSNGNYNIKNEKYLYNVRTKDLDLSFLNVTLDEYNIKNIAGKVSLDLKIQNDKNLGYLKISKFNLEKEDLFLKLFDFNATIQVRDNKIYTNNFTGKLNDGDLNFKGYVNLPSINEIIDNPYFYEDIKYSANLDLKNMHYKYGDYFYIDINTDLGIENHKLLGEFEIIKGKVTNLPTENLSILSRIKKFLFKSASKTINDSENLGDDLKIKSVIEDAIDINLALRIGDGIILDIESPLPMVTDVKGKIFGNGRLRGNSGKYVFMGSFESEAASLAINDNTFYINKALLAFNDKKAYFPNLDPNLLLDATVDMDNEKIGLGLSGKIDNLQFNISSRNGSSSGNLNSFIMGEGNENTDETTQALITNIIGGQLTQVIKPVSNIIKNIFGFSKFRIASNFTTNQNNKNSQNINKLNFGAVLEAEHNIYKDKIWWVATGTLVEEDNREFRNEETGMFKNYDTSIEYRFDYTKSIGIGVGKISQIQKKEDKDNEKRLKSNLNYHIDFKFEKKYDSLLDIFINK